MNEGQRHSTSPGDISRVNLRGLEVFPFNDPEQLIDYADRHKGILLAVNALKIANANAETTPIINSNISYPDGIGTVLAMKTKGVTNARKIPGCELWLKIVERYAGKRTFYVIGAKPEVHEQVIKKLKSEYPAIDIVGHRDGYIPDDKARRQLIDDVAEKKPDIVFVAMGSPKQEFLMNDMLARHRAIYQGLGGSFDVYTGNVPRAPKWWIDHNLEFAYRLLRQPSRLPRNLKYIPFGWWLLTRQF